MNEPLIQVKNLSKIFTVQGKKRVVLNNISFGIPQGKTLGLVGESGSGKSTLARCLLRLDEPSSGQLFFAEKDILHFNSQELFSFRRHAQIIFQDPYSSLNPRMTARDIIAEPLRIHRIMHESAMDHYLNTLLDMVGLSKTVLGRFPHEFSGGQRQRIGIARALALKPQFLICDEPLSALDVSVQAQIVNILKDLQKELKLTYLFIAHDLAMVKYISDFVAVMYLGNIVEMASSASLYENPHHPYTQALLSAIPIPDPIVEKKRHYALLGDEVSSAMTDSKGCPFVSRCPSAMAKCHTHPCQLREVHSKHFGACHLLVDS